VFRYGEGGLMTIATKTRRCEKFIENGVSDVTVFGTDKSYKFIPVVQEKSIKLIKQLYEKLLSEGNVPKDILVLSSYNKGEYGTKALNINLQPLANDIKNKEKFSYGETNFYEDDLVIQCVNNYKAVVYEEYPDPFADRTETMIPNGEIGVIKKILPRHIIIDFDGVLIEYDMSVMNQLKLAYSISTFKAQGGNAKIVILLTPKAHTYMLNSNLIYVGQTRAREKVYHFGEPETVNRAIKKKADLDRQTFLKQLLKKN
jgi:exodeoxyribonuclease V alpha subunit